MKFGCDSYIFSFNSIQEAILNLEFQEKIFYLHYIYRENINEYKDSLIGSNPNLGDWLRTLIVRRGLIILVA